MDELDGSVTSFPSPTFPPLSWESHFHYLNTREGWDKMVNSVSSQPLPHGERRMGRFGHFVSLTALRVTAGGRNP
jgi:hypothetical protein